MIRNKKYNHYQIKLYLNARHYITLYGSKGTVHPHTWEFVLRMRFPAEMFIEFKEIEDRLNECLKKYQNKLLNDCPPFNNVNPLLENVCDITALEFAKIIKDMGGELTWLSLSETPTRTYIYSEG